MADISSVNATTVTPGVPIPRATRAQNPTQPPAPTDQVEISELAQLLSSLDPDDQVLIRAQKVEEIRQAIQNGTYETEDKIDYVVTRLMQVLEQGSFAPDEAVID
ncbi:MAG TPA: flagellar biosynthesis anti-sigma factor FlgM [Phycisphaerae bacterium]|jgi:anti-sigma28 factor (negative regulator of flagellin synthesis)|nr:flagellar biosynthesis anti-sigma factor FlgM [Phycisphaerae bacterium]HOB74287.1 flagellar biosynthesis anti-sigma factor FlgM [Phycisphaerae bacterium]HOJ53122.1 flagellar biosynthesis anti-sigma factor FlgM [Phycisphaerae bacterium]HOL24859.1 flagellar biosynthesis anti-sigma factor FlgM [Phycisphaerae bacterium]HPP19395.1 flagellar biosynthesis anti-sigma factor FlgM [Phycisphaerae bacterium]